MSVRPSVPDGLSAGAEPDRTVAEARERWRWLAGPQPALGANAEARARLAEAFDRRQRAGRGAGASLVERVRALACEAVPEGGVTAVVSRGDPRLVDLPERTGWHLPQAPGGLYAGHHPADSTEALEQLDALQRRGARYLVVPAPDLWWLSYYEGLRLRLESGATLVAFHREAGAVFSLTPEPVDPRYPRFGTVVYDKALT